MAKVPTYGTNMVEERALPGPRQTGAIEGAFVDRGMQQLAAGAAQVANVATNIAIDQQRMLNADAVTRAEVAFRDAESAFRVELGNRKGINGAKAVEDANKWYDENARKHADSLENDTQRRAFNRLIGQRRATFMDFAHRHQAQEIDNAWVGSKQANMQASINAVAASGGDDPVIRQERGRIESNLADISARRGWTPEQLDQERGKVLTQMHTQVLQQLVETDPRRAHAYLDKYGTEIDGDKRAELGRYVRKGTLEADARDLSLATIGKGYNGGLAVLKQAEEEAKKIANSGEREAKLDVIEKARQMHQHEFAVREQQKNYNQRQASEAAYNWMRQNPGQMPPLSMRNAMDPHAAYVMEKNGLGDKVQTDWKFYNDLRREAMKDPGGFSQRDLSKDFDKLAPSQREQLLDLQAKAAKGGDELKDVATFGQQLTTAHDQLKFGKDDHEKRAKFDIAAREMVMQEEKAKGKKLNYVERQAVVDRLMVEGDTNGWWPGGGRRFYEVRGTADVDRFEVKVPTNDRIQIKKALEAKGKVATDAEIQRIYKKAKGLQ